jgi:3-oxoadipate enol-lactonase
MQNMLSLLGAAGEIAVYTHGNEAGPAIFMTHSILASSMMWERQVALLASRGWRVICADVRGHGASKAPAPPYVMADLVADTVSVLDALAIERVHYIGLSLGGMIGFGLGIEHADRLLSLCLCDARADAPPAFAASWDERIANAQEGGCAALAGLTAERWFGKAFVETHPMIAQRFLKMIAATSVDGFEGCARAIQKLDYLAGLPSIMTPTTLIVGAGDGPLPFAMQHIQALISGATLEVIAGAGHLPNIDQPDAFDAAMLRHLERVAPEHSGVRQGSPRKHDNFNLE